MVQYRQPLLKAFQSEISFAMHDKINMCVTVCLFIFPNSGFCLLKLDFEKCVIITQYISSLNGYNSEGSGTLMLKLPDKSDEAYEFTSYLATLCFTNEIYAHLVRHANWQTGDTLRKEL